jgi:hypothetical protein
MSVFLQALRGSSDGLPPDQKIAAVVLFMLLMLVLILCIGIFFVGLATRHARARRFADRANRRAGGVESELGAGSLRFQPPLFDSPCRWLAIRGIHPVAVQAALNLHNPAACSWEEGLAGAREQKLFISPPVGEWVLVVGSGLPDPAEDVDRCFHLLTGVSRKLGEVQFFSLNRALQHHAWARLESGRVVRAYAWAGQVLWNQGEISGAENELLMRCFQYTETSEQTDFSRPAPVSFNAEKVPLLAARWSFDPTVMDERRFNSDQGIVGDLSETKPN